ncbi:MAG: DUF3078 domain-containing protein [Bacteroidales bacterium]|jgi:hypothetical protein|nr:DUF3078 domain-containing protein [Bacteroidales bacterium]MDD2280534.1 DUF3078 domain-containing protein [Bacteroidales bacterium]MDD4293527.1 DUF3078 domain-containing protein [Bacteroidales bacterium]MDD4491295.1 DUF3078 domain-containing protein [Bacteroidales bacterium]HNW48709.1 DUF3078 domain-containing protein [Bacteroidales bacterium]
MKRFSLFFTAILFLSISLSAQDAKTQIQDRHSVPGLSKSHQIILNLTSQFSIPDLKKPEEAKKSNWKSGALLQMGFSQMSLTNWAAGGYSSVALNAYVNTFKTYEAGDMFWENRLQLAWGFINSFGENFKKSDDKIIFDSKYGYRAWKKVFFSTAFNFRSQFSNSFNYPVSTGKTLVSGPFSPAYFSLGIGLDYKPVRAVSVNFSPLTSNLVVVTKETLRTKYGNRIDQPAKLELGAQLKVDYKQQLSKDVAVASTLILFSDFLGKPQNIKVNWDLFVDTKINKYFSANIRTNLIYDDNILIPDKNSVLGKRVQFKEILSIGFSHTFGQYKK